MPKHKPPQQHLASETKRFWVPLSLSSTKQRIFRNPKGSHGSSAKHLPDERAAPDDDSVTTGTVLVATSSAPSSYE